MDSIGKKVTSGLLWNYSERLLAQFVSLIVSVILARLISPEHFGAISIVTILITLCNVFVSNGFGNALIQAKEANVSVFNALFYLSLSISLVLYLILFFVAPFVSAFYGLPILTPVIRVMGFRLPIASLNTIQHAYLVRRLEFKRFFITTLSGTLISAVVGIAMAYNGFDIWALVAQYLTNVIIDTILLFFFCGWKPGKDIDWEHGKQLLPFGAKILGTALISSAYEEISGLIIGKQFSTTDLAYYTKGKQFPSIIVTNINSSISRVLFSAMSKYQEDTERIKAMLRRSLKINMYIIGPVMVGMFACANLVIRIVLSEKWVNSVPYLQVFCFMFLLKAVRNTYIQAFNAVGKSGISLIIQLVSTVLGLLLLSVSAFVLLDVFAVAVSTLIVQIVAILICVVYSIRILNYSFFEQVKDVFPNVVALLFLIVSVNIASKAPINSNALLLLLEIITGIICYYFFSIILKIDSFHYVKGMIKSLFKKR